MTEPNLIPGMIEPIEQRLLHQLAEKIHLEGNEIVLEFGAFFGRSTVCLGDGLLNNPSFKTNCSNPVLKVVDSFSCHTEGSFRPHVEQFAKGSGLEHLLEYRGNTISFRKIFDSHTHFFPDGLLDTHETELQAYNYSGEPIKLMHVDLPKFWEEYLIIIDRCFPSLVEGAHIVFQDFFYHWSATLATPIFHWIETGILEPVQTAASSLLVRLKQKIDRNDIDNLKSDLKNLDDQATLNRCRSFFHQFGGDRDFYFVNRLLLAQIQKSFEDEDFAVCRGGFEILLKGKMLEEPGLYQDLLDLIGQGFSARTLYELDHRAG